MVEAGEIALADEAGGKALGSIPKGAAPGFGLWSVHRLYRKRGAHRA